MSARENSAPSANFQKNSGRFAEFPPDRTALGPLLRRDDMKHYLSAAALLLSLQAVAAAQSDSPSDETRAAKERAEAVDKVLADFKASWNEAKTLNEKART